MPPAAAYLAQLRELGFSDAEARLIARARATSERRPPGKIVLNADAGDDGEKSDEAELLLYDVIGFDPWGGGGLTAKALAEQLRDLGARPLTVRVNSPGGDVFDGMTIFNLLRDYKGAVTMVIDGLAASIASVIVQAADPKELRIADNAMMMIHDAWGFAIGNSAEMLEVAALLEKLDGQIADVYATRSGKKAKEFRKLMDAETWFTGEEAIAAGLADAVIESKRAAACVNPTLFAAYRNVPAALRAAALKPATPAKPLNTVPDNPPDGDGAAIDGDWQEPTLADFTDKAWEDLAAAERERIAQHFGWYENLDSFDALELAHHFAAGDDAGKPSTAGVNAALDALAELDLAEEDRAAVEAHLRAHLAEEEEEEETEESEEETTEEPAARRVPPWAAARARAVEVAERASALLATDN